MEKAHRCAFAVVFIGAFCVPSRTRAVVPKSRAERFFIRVFSFGDVRYMQRSASDLAHCTEIAAGYLGCFWRSIAGKGYRIINGELDAVLADDATEPVYVVDQRLVTPSIQNLRHVSTEDSLQPLSVVVATSQSKNATFMPLRYNLPATYNAI